VVLWGLHRGAGCWRGARRLRREPCPPLGWGGRAELPAATRCVLVSLAHGSPRVAGGSEAARALCGGGWRGPSACWRAGRLRQRGRFVMTIRGGHQRGERTSTVALEEIGKREQHIDADQHEALIPGRLAIRGDRPHNERGTGYGEQVEGAAEYEVHR